MSVADASTVPAAGIQPVVRSGSTLLGDVAMMTRPRIALMVLATVATGMWLTAGGGIGGWTLAGVLAGTALVAASSSVANQILERDTDRLMPRTAGRPLPAGRVEPAVAAILSGVLLMVGGGVLAASGGWPAAVTALATWLLYVAVYTPLKRRTPLNTAIGAIAGAMPVVIGAVAAGSPARLAAGDAAGTLAAAAFATLLYLWQFPHFMAIAWLYRRQYADAGLRMLTVDDPSGLRAAGQSLAAALAMLPVGLVLAVPSGSVRLFFAEAAAVGLYVAATAHFAVRRDDLSARRLLLASLGTLLAVMAAAVALGRPAVAADSRRATVAVTIDTVSPDTLADFGNR